MKSKWVPLVLLVFYIFLMFMVARLLDFLVWYQQGITATDLVDPLLLSVRQLKQLLEVRGVSYTGYYEKRELALLVESSADVSLGELEDLSSLVGGEGRDRLTKASQTQHFTGSAHFYEQVEDTKDSVWLVQVISGSGEPLLDDYKWQIIRHHVAPFAIRTGVFDCKLDRRLCKHKSWNEPLLLLALPKGTTPKDKVVIRTCTYTRPQQVITWLAEQLSIRVQRVQSLRELDQGWLAGAGDGANHTSAWPSGGGLRDIRVLLLTHILHPPLFLAALSIKFTGRIKFGMMTVKKEDERAVSRRLKHQLHPPCYLVVTPEQTVVYGRRPGEHFNLRAMHSLLRAVQPDANDLFLCSLIVTNMVAFLHILQGGAGCWWRRLGSGVWLLVSHNLWLFSGWLVLLGALRWPALAAFADHLLPVARAFMLTDLGSSVRHDCVTLLRHPLFFLASFLLFAFLSKRFIPNSSAENEGEDRPWWEVLPLDCLFRPMTASLSRPLPPTEVQLEEGIELLIERLAVPNLWLQPSVVPNDLVKDLPIWRHRTSTSEDTDVQQIISMMDGDNRCKYDSSSEESIYDGKEEAFECPVNGMLPTLSCAVCLETYRNNTLLCGLPCGHNYHKRCIHTWLQADNLHCPICRWPVYKKNHPRFKRHPE